MRQITDQPNQPNQPGESHKCERHAERTCNCSGGSCADDDDGDAIGRAKQYYRNIDESRHDKFIGRNFPVYRVRPGKYGHIECPVSGKSCTNSICEEYCEESISRAEAGVNWGYA